MISVIKLGSGYPYQSRADEAQDDQQDDGHEEIAPEGEDDRRQMVILGEISDKDGRGGKDRSA